MNEIAIGDVVEYVDEFGKPHAALVTATWGLNSPTRSLNLTYVSDDENKTDQYGRQLMREATSVVHESSQPAHGRYWRQLRIDLLPLAAG